MSEQTKCPQFDFIKELVLVHSCYLQCETGETHLGVPQFGKEKCAVDRNVLYFCACGQVCQSSFKQDRHCQRLSCLNADRNKITSLMSSTFLFSETPPSSLWSLILSAEMLRRNIKLECVQFMKIMTLFIMPHKKKAIDVII